MTNQSSSEPPPSPAPATSRGHPLWHRLKALLALRTTSVRDDLEVLLENEASAEAADFSEAERKILQNVLKLDDLRVDDVMVPRADIVAIEINETLGTLLARFLEAGHSRIPVYDDDLDNITGFVHVKDALRLIVEVPPLDDSPDEGRVKVVGTGLRTRIGKLDIAREALFVPPSTPVGDLLQQMQLKRVHMAIVIDEWGGTDGVVTIEDLLEAVVGDIEDEHDEQDRPLIRKLNTNNFIASARAELSEVRETVGAAFDPGELADEVDTIGGLVFDIAGHVPAPGEVVKGVNGVSGFEFEILASDGRQIQKLKIKRVRPRGERSRPRGKGAPDGRDAPESGRAVDEDETGARAAE
ncbi:MAG TPA: hemolysin family protein [Devosiaceae bacterium]|jgi:CBS domain containing-hemolysin-like protein|nr:hemolysin family protein [Devosiaceae bacterium]